MKRLPDSVKKAKDTFRGKRERKNIDVPPSDFIVPEKLSQEAKEIWCEVAATLTDAKLLTGLDRRHLMMYCEEAAKYWRLSFELQSEDDIVELYNDKGQPVNSYINPKHKLCEQALRNAHSLGAHFGLTPLARTKINLPPAKNADTPEEKAKNKINELRSKAGKQVIMKSA